MARIGAFFKKPAVLDLVLILVVACGFTLSHVVPYSIICHLLWLRSGLGFMQGGIKTVRLDEAKISHEIPQ